MNCPTCGKELRALQVETMLGNPQFNEWCRGGFCSLDCFEKRTDVGRNVPEGDTLPGVLNAPSVPRHVVSPPISPLAPARKPLARTLATACLITFPFCWVYTFVGLNAGIHGIPRVNEFYFVVMPFAFVVAGFLCGVVALCLMHKHGREGILWKSVIGLTLILAHVLNVAISVLGGAGK